MKKKYTRTVHFIHGRSLKYRLDIKSSISICLFWWEFRVTNSVQNIYSLSWIVFPKSLWFFSIFRYSDVAEGKYQFLCKTHWALQMKTILKFQMESLNPKEFSIWFSYTRKEEQGPLKTLELLSDTVVKLAEVSHVTLKSLRYLLWKLFSSVWIPHIYEICPERW